MKIYIKKKCNQYNNDNKIYGNINLKYLNKLFSNYIFW